ncbi:MAG TPA: RNA polymerase sigma factor [Polyangiaceae bacterium]|jgi:RNA polymerase sigma-70 factor (ECF subfamily)|nr:RNA polymerase sigma factor [Polyangiaceae bacterium]
MDADRSGHWSAVANPAPHPAAPTAAAHAPPQPAPPVDAPDALDPRAASTPPNSRPSLEAVAVAPRAEVENRETTFRAMYEGHVDFVWRNLRRLGVSEADVDDRTQEVFVVAHRRFAEFVDRGHGPRAWLFQIVLRVASDARRHTRRHPEVPDGGVALDRASIEPQQTEAIARREALSRLDAALASIDLSRRAVLVLHEIEEMTAREIASVLGIPLNTVYSRLRVGRLELEQALARRGDEL